MNSIYTNPSTGAKYQEQQFLGQGSFCNVWKGKDPKDKDIALKISQVLVTETQRKEYESQVLKELEIMSKLNHPNILKCYDGFYDPTQKQYILVLEYMPGGNLTNFIIKAMEDKEKDFAHSERVAIVKQLTHALHIMHSQNILHRDIKGENILLDSEKNVKIADLGIAIKTVMTKASTKSGTYQFLAPESMSEGPKNEFLKQSDLYQLGLVLHFIYFKEYLCEGIKNYFELCKKNEQAFDNAINQYFSQQKYQQNYPTEVKVIKGLLKKDPKKRISLRNVDEILQLDINFDNDNEYISKLPWQYQEEINNQNIIVKKLNDKLKEGEEKNNQLAQENIELKQKIKNSQQILESQIEKLKNEKQDLLHSNNEQKAHIESLIQEQNSTSTELKKKTEIKKQSFKNFLKCCFGCGKIQSKEIPSKEKYYKKVNSSVNDSKINKNLKKNKIEFYCINPSEISLHLSLGLHWQRASEILGQLLKSACNLRILIIYDNIRRRYSDLQQTSSQIISSILNVLQIYFDRDYFFDKKEVRDQKDFCRKQMLNSLLENLPQNLNTVKLISKGISDSEFEQFLNKLPSTLKVLQLEQLMITDNGLKSLSERIPQTLNTLQINHFPKITNYGIKYLSDKLPSNLQNLQIHCISEQITENGLKYLLNRLPSDLQVLEFTFHQITDDALKILSDNMPQTLKTLSISSDTGVEVTDSGLRYLSDNLPSNLNTLIIQLSGYKYQITDSGLKFFSDKLPLSLNTLEVQFSGGKNSITDDGIQYFSDKLPQTLNTLKINCQGSVNSITDIGLKYLADRLPPALNDLSINLKLGQHNITDEGLRHLTDRLPLTLSNLEVDFRGSNNKVTDVGIKYFSDNLPLNLKIINLYFNKLKESFIQQILSQHRSVKLGLFS